jgi:hypothetical protein
MFISLYSNLRMSCLLYVCFQTYTTLSYTLFSRTVYNQDGHLGANWDLCSTCSCPFFLFASAGVVAARRPLASSPLFAYRPGQSLLQQRQRRPSFHLFSFFTYIPSLRVSRLSLDLVPKPRYCRWPRSNCWTRLVQYCLGTICPHWLGGTRLITSVVLVTNSISFAIMIVIFTTIAADYGTFGR